MTPSDTPLTITLFGANEADFKLADQELANLKDKYSFVVYQININDDPVVQDKYKGKTPVMMVGPYTLQYPFIKQDLLIALGAAADRDRQMNQISDDRYIQKKAQGSRLTGSDRIGYWLSRHFMFLFNLFLVLYVGLPLAAPVLMKAGLEKPARVIYTIYSPLCHQLAFRSWFLFGEQTYYPRSLAGIPGMISYEELEGEDLDIMAARNFIGDDKIGYKVALCQRDMAIYASMLAFGLLFSLTGNRIPPIRWYIWIFVGLFPIGFDGFSQLPGLMNRIPEWLIIRESTPVLRSITGALFGLTTAWYLFPLIEMSMRETREILFRKISIISNMNKQ